MNPAKKTKTIRFSWKSWGKTVSSHTADGGICCNLVGSGEDSDWEDLQGCLIEKKRQAIYILLYHVGKYAVRQGFPGKFLEPSQTSTFLLCRTPQCLSMNPQECVTYTQLIGPQNLFYGNFIGTPQHTRLLEIREKIREVFCLKMSFLKVKSWRQSQFTWTRERLFNSLVPGKKSFAWKFPLVCQVDKQAFSTPNWSH